MLPKATHFIPVIASIALAVAALLIPALRLWGETRDNVVADAVQVAGFRTEAGRLLAVDADGRTRPYVLKGMNDDLGVDLIYDWTIRNGQLTGLVFAGTTVTTTTPSTALFYYSPIDGVRRMADPAMSARLSQDRLIAYTTMRYELIVIDERGRRLAEFKDASQPHWLGNGDLLMVHAADGVAADWSSNNELVIANRKDWASEVLIDSSFDVQLPISIPGRDAILFLGRKTEATSFWTLNLTTRDAVQVTNVGRQSSETPVPTREGAWSPDGEKYAYTIGSQNPSLWMLELRSGVIRSIGPGADPLWLTSAQVAAAAGSVSSARNVITVE